MLSTHPQDRSVAVDRTQEILDRLGNEIEKAGNAYGLHPDARRMVLELAERGRFARAASSIRRTVARLDGPDLSVAPPPAPRPGPKPRPRPATPPILFALDGGGDPHANVSGEGLAAAWSLIHVAAEEAAGVPGLSRESRDDLAELARAAAQVAARPVVRPAG